MSLAASIHDSFKLRDWKWTFTDGVRVPTEEEIAMTLQGMATTLIQTGNTQIEMGRLIVQREDHGFSAYIFLGDYNQDGLRTENS